MRVNEEYSELKVKTARFDFVTDNLSLNKSFILAISSSTCKMDFASNGPYFMFVENVI